MGDFAGLEGGDGRRRASADGFDSRLHDQSWTADSRLSEVDAARARVGQ